MPGKNTIRTGIGGIEPPVSWHSFPEKHLLYPILRQPWARCRKLYRKESLGGSRTSTAHTPRCTVGAESAARRKICLDSRDSSCAPAADKLSRPPEVSQAADPSCHSCPPPSGSCAEPPIRSYNTPSRYRTSSCASALPRCSRY